MYFELPAYLCDTVLRGNMCVVCDSRSNKSETNEIPARSFSTRWWSKINRFWCHRPKRNIIYGILTELWQNMKPSRTREAAMRVVQYAYNLVRLEGICIILIEPNNVPS